MRGVCPTLLGQPGAPACAPSGKDPLAWALLPRLGFFASELPAAWFC